GSGGGGASAVAAKHSWDKTRLLRLCGQACTWPAPLHVNNQDGKFGHDGQADRFRLKADPWTTGRGHAQSPAEGRTDRHADSRNLILCLNCPNAKSFHLRELMENVAGRSDRVACVDDPLVH